MGNLTEEQTKVTVAGLLSDAQIAYPRGIDKSVINNSNFVSAGNRFNRRNPNTIIGLMDSVHCHYISIWELSEKDNVYRIKARIEIFDDYSLKTWLRMPDGSEIKNDTAITL